MLLAPKINSGTVQGVIAGNNDPGVWAAQNRELLAQRPIKNAAALFVAGAGEFLQRRHQAQKLGEILDACTFFSTAASQKAIDLSTSPAKSQTGAYEAILCNLLQQSGLNCVKTVDVAREFSAQTGLVNGSVSKVIKRLAHEIHGRENYLIQSRGDEVRLLSSDRVPKPVIALAKAIGLTIQETDILIHFLDRPNESVHVSEIQVLTSAEGNSLPTIEDASRAIERLLSKLYSHALTIASEDKSDEHGRQELSWILRIDSSLHQRLALNKATESLVGESVPQVIPELGFDDLVIPNIDVHTVRPPNQTPANKTSVLRRSSTQPKPKITTVRDSPIVDRKQAEPDAPIASKPSIAEPAQKLEQPSKPRHLPAGTLDYIDSLSAHLYVNCSNEHVGAVLAARFLYVATEAVLEGRGMPQRDIVTHTYQEFRDKYQEYFNQLTHDKFYARAENDAFLSVNLEPGSSEKLKVLEARVTQGFPVFHPDDSWNEVADMDLDDGELEGPTEAELEDDELADLLAPRY